MSEEYLSTADVAARFDVPEETVRYWRHIGYGPTAAKLGRHIRYRASDWDTFSRPSSTKSSGSARPPSDGRTRKPPTRGGSRAVGADGYTHRNPTHRPSLRAEGWGRVRWPASGQSCGCAPSATPTRGSAATGSWS
jgi:hypothetical protein